MLIPIGDNTPRTRTPWVNYLLIAANTGVFLWVLFLPQPQDEQAVMRFGFIPAGSPWWTLVTSQFLHAGWMHLIGNMLFLWIAGDNIEDRLGHGTYLAFYLAAGVAAALAHDFLNPGSHVPCIGASGAISGVMGAYLVWFPRARIRFLWGIPIFIFIHWGIVELRAVWAIGLWFLLQLLSTWLGWQMSRHGGDAAGVAYGAHVGGFLFGAAAALFLRMFGFVQVRR